MPPKPEGESAEALRKLSKIRMSPSRMAILLYLLAKGRVSFTELYRELKLTPGNAWSHLEKMEKENLVKIEKTFSSRGPVTHITITQKGYEIAEELVKILSSLSKLGDMVPSGSESSEGP